MESPPAAAHKRDAEGLPGVFATEFDTDRRSDRPDRRIGVRLQPMRQAMFVRAGESYGTIV